MFGLSKSHIVIALKLSTQFRDSKICTSNYNNIKLSKTLQCPIRF